MCIDLTCFYFRRKMPLNLFGWTLPMCRTTGRATMRTQSSSNVCGPVTMFSAVLSPAGMCSTPFWKPRGPGKTKSKVLSHSNSTLFSIFWSAIPSSELSTSDIFQAFGVAVQQSHFQQLAAIFSCGQHQFFARLSNLKPHYHKSMLVPKREISKNSLFCSQSPSSLHTFSLPQS